MSVAQRKEAASVSPLILERYKPVTASLEWRIGQAYWAMRGSQAFLTNDVPHLITNDGMHAARAADVLFASCAAAARAGRLEETIQVAEFGVGLGLHAHLFLNRFQRRCAEAGVDFYKRLRFYAGDRSRKMLSDIASLGTLVQHREHVVLGWLDAACPASFLELERDGEIPLSGLRAVVHNYLLDALSFDVLLQSDGQWLRLHLQTRVDDAAAACQTTGLDVPQIRALAASADDAEVGRLLPLYELFEFERAYMPVDINQIPFGEHLESFAATVLPARANGPMDEARTITINHSHGAVASVIATLDVLRTDGFLLFNDFGSADAAHTGEWHQRYAASRAMPINLALIQHILGRQCPSPPQVATPEGDERASVHSRFVSLEKLPQVEQVFRAGFAQTEFEALGALIDQARAARTRGATDAAQALYAQAHERYPENWYALIEWAEFALYGLGDSALGVTLAEQARSMNPMSSPLVHNVYGEALYLTGRRAEARAAYLQALRLQPDDIRTHGNLAKMYADEGRFREAIAEISQAIANDTRGAYRQNLSGKLNDILDQRDAART